MDRPLVAAALFVAHLEGPAGEIDHLRGRERLRGAVLARALQQIAEDLTGRKAALGEWTRQPRWCRGLRADRGKRVRLPRASPRKAETEAVVARGRKG
jgi:hypothetical protein